MTMVRNLKSAQAGANTLTAPELPAIRTLIATQNQFGGAAAPFSAQSIVAAMAQLDRLSGAYPQFVHAAFKGWTERLYELLQNVSTVYGETFPALYLAYKVAVFPFRPGTEFVPLGFVGNGEGLDLSWVRQELAVSNDGKAVYFSVWVSAIKAADGTLLQVADYGVFPAFAQPTSFNYHQQVKDGGTYDSTGSQTRSPAVLPASPPAWNAALAALLKVWGVSAPKAVFRTNTFDTFRDVLLGVLDPASWKDVENVKRGVSELWTSQRESMNVLLAAATLTTDDYFFLLHVLLGLVSGDAELQTFTSTIVNAPADSTEYPNDIFINQLLYLVLMYLADPLGSYGWNNGQLQQFVADLTAVVTGKDEGSTAIATALVRQAKILNSASAYPMIDPYNPAVGFTQRATDTLFALDQARATLKGAA